MMRFSDKIKAIAFDADDTLWDTQSFFDKVERLAAKLLSDYGNEDEIRAEIYKTETRNMPALGFGAQAFTLSLIETAIRVSGGKISTEQIGILLKEGKNLSSLPSEPLGGVEDTLKRIKEEAHWKMAIFTKGNPLDQENKIKRSGLGRYFNLVSIVSDKGIKEYRDLCERLDVKPEEFAMVGNSFKSDILPAVEIGGTGVYIPFHTTWQLESVEEKEHENIIKISTFSELTDLL